MVSFVSSPPLPTPTYSCIPKQITFFFFKAESMPFPTITLVTTTSHSTWKTLHRHHCLPTTSMPSSMEGLPLRISQLPHNDRGFFTSSSHQASWSSLRTDHPTLTPAQLHHLLSHYQLGPGRGPPPAWDPPPAERDAVDTGEEK